MKTLVMVSNNLINCKFVNIIEKIQLHLKYFLKNPEDFDSFNGPL